MGLGRSEGGAAGSQPLQLNAGSVRRLDVKFAPFALLPALVACNTDPIVLECPSPALFGVAPPR